MPDKLIPKLKSGESIVQPDLLMTLPNEWHANLCEVHAKRVTIMPKDIQLAHRIRGQRN